MKKRIVVKFIDTYTITSEDGEKFGFTKASKLSTEKFTLGKTYEVVFTKWNDRNYIVSSKPIENIPPPSPSPIPPAIESETKTITQTPPAPTKYGKPLGGYELSQDRRIHWSGIVQAVVQSPFVAANCDQVDQFDKMVKALSESLVSFIAEKVKE